MPKADVDAFTFSTLRHFTTPPPSHNPWQKKNKGKPPRCWEQNTDYPPGNARVGESLYTALAVRKRRKHLAIQAETKCLDTAEGLLFLHSPFPSTAS